MPRRWAVLGAVAILAACSNPREAPIAGAAAVLSGDLTVFAAASLTDAFTDAEAAIERAHPRLSITSNFAGSQVLVQQLTEGAPADVVATADTRSMDRLVASRLVEPPVVLARNSLVIAVEPGNPEGVAGLGDLARPDLTVVLADPSVPVGAYAVAALARAGVTVRPRSLELDVKAALAKVAAGEADAAIVYATDVLAAKGRTSSVTIADPENQLATYPIAVVRASAHKRAARALLTELTRGRGRVALRARGFRLP
jgi:molybdate transport system substrate-binding protein